MSEIQKKAENYAEKIKNYKKYGILTNDLERYHMVSEQSFDNIVNSLEDSLQDDIKHIPEILVIYNKIITPFKKVFK